MSYVKHIVYWDDFEDYRPTYALDLLGRHPSEKTLVFRLLDNKWVLLYERDFCAPDAEMLARMNAATGQSATEIHYSWYERSPLVACAEELAANENDLILTAPVLDLRPV